MATLDQHLLQRLHDSIGRHAGSPALLLRSGSAQLRCRVVVGEAAVLIDVDRGRIDWIEASKPLTPWDFSVQGSAAAWTRFWEPMPAPGWHDLLAMNKRGEFRIEGNLLPFMTHLQFVKDLLALPRIGSAS